LFSPADVEKVRALFISVSEMGCVKKPSGRDEDDYGEVETRECVVLNGE